jgi:gliding motility-associated-like protein
VNIIFNSAPAAANAGTDKSFCGNTVAMTANTPTSGTGAWSVVSGAGGTFSNASSASTNFTGVAGTTYTLRWTLTNPPCAPSADDVTVTLVAPPTVANAGADQVVCNTTATLSANTPTIGTGTWSVVTGAGGTITNPASPGSTFTGNANVTYTLRWTTTNGICNPSSDDVTISLNTPPTTAQAGADQNICGTSVALSANTPASGTGAWSIVSGSGGTVNAPASPTSNFTGVAGNTYTLRWTVSKNGCASSTDEVSVTFRSSPRGSGIISPATALCEGTSAILTVTGFTNATTFQWSTPAGITAGPGNGSSLEITAESGGGGTVTVTPQNDCGPGATASVALSVLPRPSLEIILPPAAFPEEVVAFSFNSDQSIQSSEWSFGDGATAAEASPQHAYGNAGDFEVFVEAITTNGCPGSASATYTVLSEPELSDYAIKNVITANGDDKNRILYIENLDRFPENEVRFLDRWGVEIFSASNYQNDWEARGRDGQFLPAGQYICIVKLNSTGKVISRTVSILKGR